MESQRHWLTNLLAVESPGQTAQRAGLLLLRLAPAIVFIVHGYLKLFGGQHDLTVALFLTVNIPLAEPAAWVVGALELVGGLGLLLGILVRPFAAFFALEMAVIIYKVRLPQGFIGGWEYELTLLLVCIGLAVLGSGRFRSRASLL